MYRVLSPPFLLLLRRWRAWNVASGEVDVFFQAVYATDADAYVRQMEEAVRREHADFLIPLTDVEVDALCALSLIHIYMILVQRKGGIELHALQIELAADALIKQVLGVVLAVSYTHLDVYKRQVLGVDELLQAAKDLAVVGGKRRAGKGQLHPTVAIRHLGMGIGRIVGAAQMHLVALFLKPCLLYTSRCV